MNTMKECTYKGEKCIFYGFFQEGGFDIRMSMQEGGLDVVAVLQKPSGQIIKSYDIGEIVMGDEVKTQVVYLNGIG